MSFTFDPNLVYPSDEVGQWVEISGPITQVDEIAQLIKIVIDSEYGHIEGYVAEPMYDFVKKARYARIRVYESGGGCYPDNRVRALSTCELSEKP